MNIFRRVTLRRTSNVVVHCGAIASLFAFMSGFGGCPSDSPPPPPLQKDAAWCDIHAVPCTAYQYDEGSVLPTGCATVACDNGVCQTTLASAVSVGDRACFNHSSTTPLQACTALCDVDSEHLNTIRWPVNYRSFCFATVNTVAEYHPNLNSDGYETNACEDPGGTYPLPSQGTITVRLSGAGTATLGGSSPTSVGVSGGYFNMSAPKTSCSALDLSCPAQINQIEVDFEDFPFSGHTISGLRVFLDEQVLTSSGVYVPATNRFVFTIPQGVNFDAKAQIDGALTGLVVTSTTEAFGSIDLATGDVTFQFDVSGPYAGNTLEISGTATSSAVVSRAPVITPPPDITIEAPQGECSSAVTLTASAYSAAGLPVTLYFSDADEYLGSGASVTATLEVGTHDITILGVDSNGMQHAAHQTVTVSGTTAPIIVAPPDIVVTSCSNVNIGQATVIEGCGDTPTVTNDAPAKFQPGTTIVTYSATDTYGNVATAQQRVTMVLGNDASCCPAGTNVIVGTSNNDVLTGTSSSDCILGLGAQDTINGLGGNDYISAGDGDDVVDSGAGNDVVFAGSGQDVLNGGTGADVLYGGDGDDRIRGGGGNDTLRGGQGQDLLQGQDGNDTLYGDDGDDNLQGDAGVDNLVGGVNHDTCTDSSGTTTYAQCEFGAPDSCNDYAKNGVETDVDCGGACADCAAGASCETSSDCQSSICSSGICQISGGSGTSPISTSITFNTDWGGGYCAVLNVTNSSTQTATSFTVNLDTNASTIYTSWNGNFSTFSGAASVTPCCDWNGTLSPGETDTSIGFCANRTNASSGTLPFVLNTTGTF